MLAYLGEIKGSRKRLGKRTHGEARLSGESQVRAMVRPKMEREYKPPEDSERRTFHRHPFVAQAEVTEVRTGQRIAAQTTELSPSGCYMGATDPFAEGAKVRVKLTKDGQEFESGAIVLRVHAEFGMGVAFDELNPTQQAILDRWLDEIPG